MRWIFLLLFVIKLACCEIDINDIFTTPPPGSLRLPGHIEVTTSSSGYLAAKSPCGEGDKLGKLCVPYYQCDGKTKTIVQSGTTNGFGVIDIRGGVKDCPKSLEVCCGLPPGGLDPNLPQPGDPIAIPTTTEAPDTSGETPVAPKNICGIRNSNGIDFKITGNSDHESEYGEFPWMVAILKKDFDPAVDEYLAFCGGSLINPSVVVTAAHCVDDYKENEIKIRAGEWDTQTTRERIPYQERNVVNIIIHKNFNNRTVYNDVALLILDQPVDDAENVGNICLPPQNQRFDSKECYFSGWGKDVFGKAGRYQVILKKFELPIVKNSVCQEALRKTRLGDLFKLHTSFICAGGEEGKDACLGDGGSPLVCPDPRNAQRYLLAGMVSWGIGCGEVGVPGVYADVAKYRAWIDQEMRTLNLDKNSYLL